ncbi:MAG: S1C family serine protease [Desulfobacterota bacterium]|nr:S1C family serine protease [Thermodesulfobacteriota bacterium]
MKNLHFIASFIFLFLACTECAWAQDSISRLADKYQASAVAVIAMDQENRTIRTGSGFFVDRHGVIATSHHVLEGAARAMIRLGDRQEGEVLDILSDDPECDLLMATTSLKDTVSIPFGDSSRIAEGEEVLIIGYSPGRERTLSAGRILGSRRAGSIELLQISAPLFAGCSGAPVLNKKGEVLGVATAFADLSKELNFAVPIHYLRALKPARANWTSLREKSVRFEASMADATVTEILVTRDQKEGTGDTARSLKIRSASRPGPVYFRNGKAVFCDAAWKQGSTVFLVIHGKGYAVSYNAAEIDMKKSFEE